MTNMIDMRPVLVTTVHRGVFFGWIPKDADVRAKILALKGARMAIHYGTTHGVAELAATGPTDKSKIGSRADIPALHAVTMVLDVTPEAVENWERA